MLFGSVRLVRPCVRSPALPRSRGVCPRRLTRYPAEKLRGALGFEFVGVIDNIALRYFQLRSYPEAKATYLKALDLLFGLTELPEELRSSAGGGVYHQLGRAPKQRQWPQAEQHYQQALAIRSNSTTATGRPAPTTSWAGWRRHSASGPRRSSTTRGAGDQDRIQRPLRARPPTTSWAGWRRNSASGPRPSSTTRGAGDLRRIQRSLRAGWHLPPAGHGGEEQQGQWPKAEQYYKRRWRSRSNSTTATARARTYHQLGRVAQEQRQWAEARNYFLEDLAIATEFEDQHSTAITLLCLARLWQASADEGLPSSRGCSALLSTPDQASELLRGPCQTRIESGSLCSFADRGCALVRCEASGGILGYIPWVLN